MWVQVLPADPAQEVYFKELSDNQTLAMAEMRRIVHGHIEVVKTQALVNKFGLDSGMSKVVMVVNEEGQLHNMPVNKKASHYYPNDQGIQIRGDTILVGLKRVYDPEDGPGEDFTSMPPKWKTIYDMESVLEEFYRHEKDPIVAHKRLDELLLESADPDIRDMYLEARDEFSPSGWWNE